MKIVVPIMPTSLEEAQELELSRFEGADIIEWRADFLDKDSILTVAPAIFEKFAGFEIVFTIRTTREGGKLELTDAEYVALIKDVAAIYSHVRLSLTKCSNFQTWFCLIITLRRHLKTLWHFYLRWQT